MPDGFFISQNKKIVYYNKILIDQLLIKHDECDQKIEIYSQLKKVLQVNSGASFFNMPEVMNSELPCTNDQYVLKEVKNFFQFPRVSQD